MFNCREQRVRSEREKKKGKQPTIRLTVPSGILEKGASVKYDAYDSCSTDNEKLDDDDGDILNIAFDEISNEEDESEENETSNQDEHVSDLVLDKFFIKLIIIFKLQCILFIIHCSKAPIIRYYAISFHSSARIRQCLHT